MFCKFPHFGVTISLDGRITSCCANNVEWHSGHLKDIDNIQKHVDEDKRWIRLRNDTLNEIYSACSRCYRSSMEGRLSRWNLINETPLFQSITPSGKIEYLEYSTSNICNQTCVTCSSYYSSKWKTVEDEAEKLGVPLRQWKLKPGGFNSYGYPEWRMSDQDVATIVKLLPQLKMLYVKGGEPFADQRNFDILNELKKVNPSCKVHLTTNYSKVPDKFIKILEDLDNVSISVSIDGIGDTYEYVRSTKFDQTIENLRRTKHFKILSVVNFRVNIYNFYQVKEILEFWNTHLLNGELGVKRVTLEDWIKAPEYVSPLYLLEEKTRLKQVNEIKDMLIHPNIRLERYYSNANGDKRFSSIELETNKKRFHQNTEFMNKIRGINIYDLYPQLKLI